MFKFCLGILVALIGASAWLLTRPATPEQFAAAYHEALRIHEGDTAAIEAGLSEFERVYADLTDQRIGERMRSLYAESIYFNDSLKTFTERDELVDYMIATGNMLDESEVRIDGVLRDGADVFVRWTMRFTTTALGRPVDSESVGISHLRFDADGRIVLHQDFWDSAAGLYRNLPVIGYALENVDRSLAGGD